MATVTIGPNPRGIAVNPKTNLIYASFLGNSTVKGGVDVINGATNRVVSRITVGNGPRGVAVNPVTKRVCVANQADSTVSVIIGDKVLDTIPLGSSLGPFDVAVNPKTNRVYVANIGIGSPAKTDGGLPMSVIDGRTDSVIASVPVGFFPSAVAVNPTTNRIYVTSLSSNVAGLW